MEGRNGASLVTKGITSVVIYLFHTVDISLHIHISHNLTVNQVQHLYNTLLFPSTSKSAPFLSLYLSDHFKFIQEKVELS